MSIVSNVQYLNPDSGALVRAICDGCGITFESAFRRLVPDILCRNCRINHPEASAYLSGWMHGRGNNVSVSGIDVPVFTRLLQVTKTVYQDTDGVASRTRNFAIGSPPPVHPTFSEMSETCKTMFVRGLIESRITSFDRYLDEPYFVVTDIDNTAAAEYIGKFARVSYRQAQDEDTSIALCGHNCIDLLGTIYRYMVDDGDDFFLSRVYSWYVQCISWKPRIVTCRIVKTLPQAILPQKQTPSDVGYDLAVVRFEKILNNGFGLYDTGIRISLDQGYYAEISPNKQLAKSGYVMWNCVTIINASPDTTIKVALSKADADKPDLKFPFVCCKLIVRPHIHVDIIEKVPDAR